MQNNIFENNTVFQKEKIGSVTAEAICRLLDRCIIFNENGNFRLSYLYHNGLLNIAIANENVSIFSTGNISQNYNAMCLKYMS